jgi:S-adenosyl-L-methionine hydrolase (adenosine-forming)
VSGVLTLLTDFGWADPWVAEVKGAICSQWARWPAPDPRPQLVDLGHDVPRGDVAAAAWFLERAAAAFPPGTVHLAVVDPGVGSARPAVACAARGQCFVGPGNGLLAFLAGAPDLLVVRLEDLCGRGHPRDGQVSATFHGRDLFAPAAARLALGEPVALLGPPADAAALGALPAPPRSSAAPAGAPRVVWVDHFGNAITDLVAEAPAAAALAGGGRLLVGGQAVPGPFANYAAAPPGEPFWYWGSGGTLEIAVPGGHAAERLGLRPGLVLAVAVP